MSARLLGCDTSQLLPNEALAQKYDVPFMTALMVLTC